MINFVIKIFVQAHVTFKLYLFLTEFNEFYHIFLKIMIVYIEIIIVEFYLFILIVFCKSFQNNFIININFRLNILFFWFFITHIYCHTTSILIIILLRFRLSRIIKFVLLILIVRTLFFKVFTKIDGSKSYCGIKIYIYIYRFR